MNKLIIIGVVVVLAAAGVFAFSRDGAKTDDAMMQQEPAAMNTGDAMPAKDDAMMQGGAGAMHDDPMMATSGAYVAYAPERLADAAKGKVVLFFRASWCPTCRALDKDIRANAAKIPAGVTILDVDYDTAVSLKQKYGVTTQHTLVQVDAQGNQIAKWGGSPSLSALVASIK